MNYPENRTITIERTFNTPVALVWEAWTQPEHIASWWAPNGMTLDIVEHSFTVGGKWKFSMPMPDGNEFISEGIYKEIILEEKIIFTADFKPMTENVEIHVLFKADGDKTHFTFHVIHETEAYCQQQEKMGIYNGWGSAFDRLEQFVAS